MSLAQSISANANNAILSRQSRTGELNQITENASIFDQSSLNIDIPLRPPVKKASKEETEGDTKLAEQVPKPQK